MCDLGTVVRPDTSADIAFDRRVALAAGAGVGVLYAAAFTALFDGPGGDDRSGNDAGGDADERAREGDVLDAGGGTTREAGVATAEADPAGALVVYAWFFGLGLVMYAVCPVINAITTEYSEREFSGSLFGLMLTAGSLGGAAGPLVFGWLAEAVGIGVAFPAVAGTSLLGALAFLALFRV